MTPEQALLLIAATTSLTLSLVWLGFLTLVIKRRWRWVVAAAPGTLLYSLGAATVFSLVARQRGLEECTRDHVAALIHHSVDASSAPVRHQATLVAESARATTHTLSLASPQLTVTIERVEMMPGLWRLAFHGGYRLLRMASGAVGSAETQATMIADPALGESMLDRLLEGTAYTVSHDRADVMFDEKASAFEIRVFPGGTYARPRGR